MKAVLFASSVRPGRMNDRVLKFASERLTESGNAVRIVDPKDIDLPILRTALQFYANDSDVPEKLAELNSIIKEADILIFTTSEYNRCIPPALSNMLDHLPHSTFAFKPAGIVAYTTGLDGGQQAAGQLRQMLSELGCLVVPHSLVLYQVNERLSVNGGLNGSSKAREALTSEMDLVIEQTVFVANRMHDHKPDYVLPKVHPYA
ncbi:unnamed protein product [Calicophoron daubneyi]|uniref:NADPH-dependent FMN reductase-like domain-containing protein n=1 Tax=Calicophoron daubneyi TaxID=300641 RepID=A0AAV2TR76_CALDB